MAMAEAAVVEADQGSSSSPQVFVSSFQKNEQRKFKFLEGEPKALGITQICLNIFYISCAGAISATNVIIIGLIIPSLHSSLLIFIAGGLAIGAKNLHLPTLRACLGMEVVAGVVSLFNVLVTLFNLIIYWDIDINCSYHQGQMKQICLNYQAAHTHLFAELMLTQVAQFGISVTLVVYAAKVGPLLCCCSKSEVAVVEADQGSSSSPQVFVSFQKNEQRKLQFLEGEPKVLGIIQICLNIFYTSCAGAISATNVLSTADLKLKVDMPSLISSLLIFIAGGLAIGAKNLHLPTLRACLGMEVVAGVVSLFNVLVTLFNLIIYWGNIVGCFYLEGQMAYICLNDQAAHTHLFIELILTQLAQFAISVTLVVYAAKVAHSCAAAPKVPVTTIQAPPSYKISSVLL